MSSREISFGYNAVLSISEDVINRLVGAAYDNLGTETFVENVYSVKWHLWMLKPSFRFDRADSRPGKNCVLSLRMFGKNEDNEEFAADVDIWCALRKSSTGLQLALNEVTVSINDLKSDVVLRVFRHINPSMPSSTLEIILKFQIAAILQRGDFDELAYIPINFSELSVLRTAMRTNVDGSTALAGTVDYDISIDTPWDAPESEIAAINFAFYNKEEVYDTEVSYEATRGEIADVHAALLPGHRMSFRLSSAAFEVMIGRVIEEMFIRFSVQVPRSLPYSDPASNALTNIEHITFLSYDDGYHVTVSSPIQLLESRRLQVIVHSAFLEKRNGEHYWDLPANVVGQITNHTTGASVPFSTDDDGFFYAVIDAEEGDFLKFHGEAIKRYFEEGAVDFHALIPPPSTIAVSNGSISMDGTLELDFVSGGNTCSVDYSANVTITAPEHEVAISTDIDIDLDPSIYNNYKSRFIGEFNRMVGGKLKDLLPSLDQEGLIAFFPEEVVVQEEGVILSGDIVAGRLVSSGIMFGEYWDREGNKTTHAEHILRTNLGKSAKIDEGAVSEVFDVHWETGAEEVHTYRDLADPPRTDAVKDCEGRQLSTESAFLGFSVTRDRHSEWMETGVRCRCASESASGFRVEVAKLGKVEDFGCLDVDDISERMYSAAFKHDYSSCDELEGEVFGVHSPWGNYSAVQTRYLDYVYYKWVTFQKPNYPGVELVAEWCKDLGEGDTYAVDGIDMMRHQVERGARRYWVDLQLTPRNLHVPETSLNERMWPQIWTTVSLGPLGGSAVESDVTDSFQIEYGVYDSTSQNELQFYCGWEHWRWNSGTRSWNGRLEIAADRLVSRFLNSEGRFQISIRVTTVDIFERGGNARCSFQGEMLEGVPTDMSIELVSSYLETQVRNFTQRLEELEEHIQLMEQINTVGDLIPHDS